MTLDEANLTRFEAQAALSKAQDELKAVEATFVNLKRELDEGLKSSFFLSIYNYFYLFKLCSLQEV